MRSLLSFSTIVLFLVTNLSAQEVRLAIPVRPICVSYEEDALFLAGKELPVTSPLTAFQLSSSYQEHRTTLQKTWDEYEQLHFIPMREWSLQELPQRIRLPSVICYYTTCFSLKSHADIETQAQEEALE